MRWLFYFLPLLLLAQTPKTVLCLTIPKAGTQLLRKTLAQLTGTPPVWINHKKPFPSDGKIYITHLFPDMPPIDFETTTCIFLIRDPRDVMVSFQYHLIGNKGWPFCRVDRPHLRELSRDEQLHEILLLPPRTPKDSLLLALPLYNNPNVLLIRFEDLVGEEGGGSREAQRIALAKLADAIGSPHNWAELDEIAKGLFGGTGTFRKGLIGAWQTSYSDENKALFKTLLGQTTLDLGYATDLDW